MSAAILLATGEESRLELPLSPWFIGIGAFGLLVVLLLITLTFGKDR